MGESARRFFECDRGYEDGLRGERPNIEVFGREDYLIGYSNGRKERDHEQNIEDVAGETAFG